METMGKAMSKMMETTVAAPSKDDAQDWLQAAAEEPMRWRRAEAEQEDSRTLTDKRSERLHLIGYISTKLPRYEVLQESVATTFPDAERKCNPCMLGNGFSEVMFHTSHAKDRAVAHSPYDLAGTVIVCLV